MSEHPESAQRGPRFSPFRALRYAPGSDYSKVIAPPYDVLSDADVAELRARDPHQIVHIDVPVDYPTAARNLTDWVASGVLVRDPEPSLTIYRMAFTDATGASRELVGVLGGLEVVDAGAGKVLPHERTTKKASTDRLDLTRATDANLSPVWGLSLARGLTALLAEPAELMGSLTVDGVVHTAERVSDPQRLAAISAIIGSDDVLIADGHHRYGVSRVFRDEVRAATGRTDTMAEDTLTFVGELVPEQLAIDAIHRLVIGHSHEQVSRILAHDFDLEAAPTPTPAMLAEMVDRGRLVLLAPDGSATWLIPHADAFDGIRSLDGAWLEHTLAGPLADGSLRFDYQHGLPEMLTALREGRGEAGILIRPTSITEIERTGREGLLMPPKSTFFTPKLRTGLVVREINPPA